MKKILTLFVLASLITSAAPPSQNPPTFGMDSCDPSDTTLGDCDTIGIYSFSGVNYSTKKDYLIYATSPDHTAFDIPVTVNPDGSMSAQGFGAAAGTWTFTIYSLRHNGNPIAALGSVDNVVFAD